MRGASRQRTATADGPRRVAGWVLILGLCLVVLATVSGPAGAADTRQIGDNDTDPPEWENTTKEGPEEIAVTFFDNSTIDRESIAPADFVLSNGTVANISISPTSDGSRAGVRVLLLLDGRLDTDTITVAIAPDGEIADVEGNELVNGSATVTDMDTSVPDFERFEVTAVNESTVEVTVGANEPLGELLLTVSGPVEDELSIANFTAVDDTNTTFRTTYTVPEYGAYSFVWERAFDVHDNMRPMSRMRQFRYEDSAPDVVMDGPDATTVDTVVNFSAAATVDEDGIDSYRWRIDGGTLLSGESIEIAFAAAGRHEIALEVTDSEGNVGVATRQVSVRQTADNPGAVRVNRSNDTHATADIEGTGLVQQVRPENGSLVTTGTVTLDRLSAAFPVNRTVTLDLRANATANGTGDRQWFGGFDVGHASPADRVSLRFTVDSTSLNRTDVDPGDIVLYRAGDGWTPLTTSVLQRGDETVRYQATAPGLSQFAVGTRDGDRLTVSSTNESTNETAETDASTDQAADTESSTNETADTAVSDAETTTEVDDTTPDSAQAAPGRQDISITNVTVNATDPSVGDTVTISVTASNQGTADGSYPFSVRLNGTTVATHELSVPAGETRTQRYEQNLTTTGPLEVSGETAATVTEDSGGGSLLPESVAGLLSGLPNPLALWPSGIVGTVLGALIGLVVVVYSVLKALAIYLGY